MIKGKMGGVGIGSLVPSAKILARIQHFFSCTLDCNRGFFAYLSITSSGSLIS